MIKDFEIQMQREPSGIDHTYGIMQFESLPKMDTMEDEYRAVKVPGETRIAAGRYRILFRKEGGMHTKYLVDPRFRGIHQGMLELQDVPNFKFVYIHPLTTDDNTDGCIGPGYGRGVYRGQPAIFNSAKAYTDLYIPCAAILTRGDNLFINIRD